VQATSTVDGNHVGPERSPAELAAQLQRESLAQLAELTGGLAPEPYVLAWWDWCLQLAAQPEQQLALGHSAVEHALESFQFAAQAAQADVPPPAAPATDKRFANAAWNQWPFNVYAHTYSGCSSWWNQALHSAPSMQADNLKQLEFASRQLLDACSPAHYLPTNPELLETTRAEAGANLMRGFQHWLEDVERDREGGPVQGTEHYRAGEHVAITPGKVVFQNSLMELIQYAPQTESVYAEPILITPAWIMKYYILDLSPANSLVRYLVEQGHTVFMISWKNPDVGDRELDMDNYLALGLRTALDVVSAIVPGQRIHTAGYCVGGTLLSIGAAALAAEGDERIASVTLMAGQTDFSESGELSVFITPGQLEMLDALLQRDGVLESARMAGAFALLRSNDLILAPAVDTYLRGKRAALSDLMAWNADGTRMPARMLSVYLKRLYLHNELARGLYTAAGVRVDLARIQAPMFVVGTETDHVAPWRSVYKVRGLTNSTDYTFLLTSGGHNGGIVSGAVNPKRRHRTLTWSDAATTLTPDQWLEAAKPQSGSWWPTWQQWLVARSHAERAQPPALGNVAAGYASLRDAPGQYVQLAAAPAKPAQRTAPRRRRSKAAL
jgi:polyhydroxyalkanoate synthase